MSTEGGVYYIRSVDIALGSVGIVIGVSSLVINSFILVILLRLPRRSVPDTVFCHLAVTDIIASLDAVFAFSLLLADRTFFDFYCVDDIICQFTGITWCVVSIATPLLLSIVSTGRFLALYLPHSYDSFFTPRLSASFVALSWLISIIGGTMHVWKWEPMRMNPKWGYCDYRLVDIYTKNQVRYIVIFLYSIPLTFSTGVLLFCNLAVAVRLLRLKLQKPLASFVQRIADIRKVTARLDLVFVNTESDAISFDSAADAKSGLRRDSANTPQSQGDSTKGRRRTAKGTLLRAARRRRKEKQVIIATLLFSLNFGVCYFVMLYYYFSYMISPTYNVFEALARGDPVKDTYILGWFYYATFLSSSIDPFIHILCNSKVRLGAKGLLEGIRRSVARVTGGARSGETVGGVLTGVVSPVS